MDSRLRKPSQIFEYFAELTKNKENEDAQITSTFPKDCEGCEDTLKQLPKFAFPTQSKIESEEHFTFVLTDLDSKFRFGFCRYPRDGKTCMVFVSDLPWYKVFYRSLDKIAELKLNHQNEVIQPFLAGLQSHPLPNLGVDTVLSVVPKGVDTGQVYTFPLPTPKRLPEIPTDDNLTQFYTNLHYNVILHLFANMMFERRIIITSSSLTLLSATVHGAVMLLYPLYWQHIFIPITPLQLTDYCAAPMPFLMGVHSSMMEVVRKMPLDDVVILDVDESSIESPHVDDLTALPFDVIITLKHVLKKQSSAYGDTVTRAFMLAQVAMIGGYRSALTLREGEKEVLFNEEMFLKSRPNIEEFLECLLHFQHFRQFINGRIEKLKNRKIDRDIFDNEVLTYEEELKGTTQEQFKAAFDKFISSTVVGSKKLGVKLKDTRDKVVDKSKDAWKEAKKNMQGGKADLRTPHVIEHTALLQQAYQLTDRRAFSSSDIRKVPTSDLAKQRKPPPVIPYHRHVEGKQRLFKQLESSRLSMGSPQDVPVGLLFSLTPPDTPRSVPSADQSSLDRMERASLDSKSSTEVSVASGEVAPAEVAVGDLVDISSMSSGGGSAVKPIAEEQGSPASSGSYSSIDSVVSTTSSSGVEGNTQLQQQQQQQQQQKKNWERFDEEETDRPPIPPPRSELKQLYSDPPPAQFQTGDSAESAKSQVEYRVHKSKNPFERGDSIATNQFEDFSSSIARMLFENAKKHNESDPKSADALTTTSMDLFRITGSSPECDDSPTILTPTTSSTGNNATSNVPTNISRSSGSSPNNLETPSSLTACTSSPDISSLDFGVRNVDSSGRTRRGSLEPSEWAKPRQAALFQRTQLPSSSETPHPTNKAPVPSPAHRERLAPPQKPEPYTGAGTNQYKQTNPFLPSSSTAPSSLCDPFSGLLGDVGGMVGYIASGEGNSHSTTANGVEGGSPLV